MPLDFDPLYHTETMVRILREQGSPQLAMELAQTILARDPHQQGVAQLFQELKDEARLAFERFKSGGRPAETAEAEMGAVETLPGEIAAESLILPVPAEEELPPDPIPQALTLVHGGRIETFRQKKIRRLEALLGRIQRLRGKHETSHA